MHEPGLDERYDAAGGGPDATPLGAVCNARRDHRPLSALSFVSYVTELEAPFLDRVGRPHGAEPNGKWIPAGPRASR